MSDVTRSAVRLVGLQCARLGDVREWPKRTRNRAKSASDCQAEHQILARQPEDCTLRVGRCQAHAESQVLHVNSRCLTGRGYCQVTRSLDRRLQRPRSTEVPRKEPKRLVRRVATKLSHSALNWPAFLRQIALARIPFPQQQTCCAPHIRPSRSGRFFVASSAAEKMSIRFGLRAARRVILDMRRNARQVCAATL